MSHIVEKLREKYDLLDRPKKPRIINGESAVEYRWRLLRNCLKSISEEILKEDAVNLCISHGIQIGRNCSLNQPITDCLLQLPKLILLDGCKARFYDSDCRLKDIVSPQQVQLHKLIFAKHVNHFVSWQLGSQNLHNLDSDLNLLTSSSTDQPVTHAIYNDSKEEVVTFECGKITSWVFRYGNRHLLVKRQLTDQVPQDFGFQLVALEATASKKQRLFCVRDKSIFVYSLFDRKCLSTHGSIHSDSITAIHFFNPLKLLCTGARDGSIKIWNSDSFLVYCVFVGHHHTVNDITFYPNGPMIVSASDDCTIKVWHLELKDQIDEVACQNPVQKLHSVHNHNTFYAQGTHSITAWNVNELFHHHISLCSEIQHLHATSLSTAPQRVLAQCSDSSAHIIAPKSGCVLSSVLHTRAQLHSAQMCAAAYAIDLEIVFCALTDGRILKWDSSTQPAQLCAEWTSLLSEDCSCNCIVVYEYTVSKQQQQQQQQEQQQQQQQQEQQQQTSTVKTLLVAGRSDGKVCTISTQTGEIVYSIDAHGNKGVVQMIANPGEDQIVSAGWDNIIRVWRVFPFVRESLAPLMQFFCAHTPIFMTVQRSFLMVGFQDNHTATYSSVLYDLQDKSRQDHNPDDDHLDKFTGVAASHKLRQYVSVSQDGTLRVWNSGNQLVKLLQLHARPRGVTFCSERGDLLFGIGSNIYRIDHRNYLPKMQRRKMTMMHFVEPMDDPSDGREIESNLFSKLQFIDQKRLNNCRPAFSFKDFADEDELEEEADDKADRLAREAAFSNIESREMELRQLRDGQLKPEKSKARKELSHEIKEEAFENFLKQFLKQPEVTLPQTIDIDALAKETLDPTPPPKEQKWKRETAIGFFPPLAEAQPKQAVSAGGFIPNSVLVRLLWPKEEKEEEEEEARKRKTWRPPEFTEEQLRQLQQQQQRSASEEAARKSLLQSWTADSDSDEGGLESRAGESESLVFELDSERRKREKEAAELLNSEQSDFMKRMQQAMTEAADEAKEEPAIEGEEAAVEEEEEEKKQSVKTETPLSRQKSQLEQLAKMKSSLSSAKKTPKKAPPPLRPRASRSDLQAPSRESTTLSAASERQQQPELASTESPQQTAMTIALPHFVSQFEQESWFQLIFPSGRSSLPEPLTPSSFAGAIASNLISSECSWQQLSQMAAALQQLHSHENLKTQSLAAAKAAVHQLLQTPPTCSSAEQREFIRQGLSLLTNMRMPGRDQEKHLLQELLLWYFEGDDLIQSFVMDAMNYLGRKDEHHCLERQLNNWDEVALVSAEQRQRREEIRRAIGDWLERWLLNFRSSLRQAADRLARGESLTAASTSSRRPQRRPGGRQQQQEERQQQQLDVTLENVPDPAALAEAATFIDAINYFCETQLHEQMARLRSKKRSELQERRRRTQASNSAAGVGEQQQEKKNTILVLPTLPPKASLLRLGESHGDHLPAIRGAGEGRQEASTSQLLSAVAAASAVEGSQPAACRPLRAYQHAMSGGFAPLMRLPMKMVDINPFRNDLDELDWLATNEPLMFLTLKCSSRVFMPALSQVQ